MNCHGISKVSEPLKKKWDNRSRWSDRAGGRQTEMGALLKRSRETDGSRIIDNVGVRPHRGAIKLDGSHGGHALVGSAHTLLSTAGHLYWIQNVPFFLRKHAPVSLWMGHGVHVLRQLITDVPLSGILMPSLANTVHASDLVSLQSFHIGHLYSRMQTLCGPMRGFLHPAGGTERTTKAEESKRTLDQIRVISVAAWSTIFENQIGYSCQKDMPIEMSCFGLEGFLFSVI